MAVSLSSIFGFYPVFLSRFLVSLFFSPSEKWCSILDREPIHLRYVHR